jgi:hypothetical protein
VCSKGVCDYAARSKQYRYTIRSVPAKTFKGTVTDTLTAPHLRRRSILSSLKKAALISYVKVHAALISKRISLLLFLFLSPGYKYQFAVIRAYTFNGIWAK